MSVTEVFRRITAALDQTGIGYMLSGSFASAYHGVARSIQDIDLIIEATPAQLRALVKSLPREEFYADLDATLEAQRRQSSLRLRWESLDHAYMEKWIGELGVTQEWNSAMRRAGR